MVDSPIANAVVSVTVGGTTYSTISASDGSYTLSLVLDPAQQGSAFITLTANGSGDQSYVGFTSLLGSFQALLQQAGSSGVLSPDRNFGTNITNVTTAAASLLQQANGGQPITSDDQLQTANGAVNGQDVLDLATAIKLLVDDPADFPMPSGQSSTLALALDPQASSAYVAQVQAQAPDTFSQTSTVIASDPNLSQPLPANTTPANVTAAVLSTDLGFTFNDNDRISGYTFAADGTGTAYTGSFNDTTTWTVSGATIHVAYDHPQSVTSFPYVSCGGQTQQVQATYTNQADDLVYLSNRTVTITNTPQIAYAKPCDGEPAGVTTTTALTALQASDYQTVDPTQLPSALTLPVYQPGLANGEPFGSDLASFKADGSGSTQILGQGFHWSVSGGNTLVLDFGGGVVGSYHLLRALDSVVSDVEFEFDTPAGHYADANASIAVTGPTPVFDAQGFPGRYFQFGNTDPGSAFALRFDSGGTGSMESYYLDDQGNPQVVDSDNEPDYIFNWAVDGSRIDVRSSQAADGAFNCDYTTANCFLYDWRSIVPMAVSGSRYYWIEQRRSDNNNSVTSDTPFTLLARFYDKQAPAVQARQRAAKRHTALAASPHAAHAKAQVKAAAQVRSPVDQRRARKS